MEELLTPELRSKILEAITPTEDEINLQRKAITSLIESLQEYAGRIDQTFSFIKPQGSTGIKQTQLRGTSDIDLFVALDPDAYSNVLSMPIKKRNSEIDYILERMIEKWFIPACKNLNISSITKAYSQHPYLTVEFMNNSVDLLVCFDLSKESLAMSGPITAVDRTVHHSNYVAEKLDTRLREDIRILKSFTRASYAYGDSCAVGQMGFTGYSLELLVINKGRLLEALRTLHDLSSTPLDPLKRPLSELKEIPAFRDDQLFIIDPTDTQRNVASSFSERSYKWLRKRISDLFRVASEKPQDVEQMIIERPISTEEIPSWLIPHAFAYEFESAGSFHYTILRDKLYRFARKIVSILEKENTGEKRFGEVVFEVFFEKHHYALAFVTEEVQVSETYSRKGPPVNIPEADNFRNAHVGVYEMNDHLWVDVKRKWTNASELIEALIAKNQVKGLERKREITDVGKRALNVLYTCVLPIEQDFPFKAIV